METGKSIIDVVSSLGGLAAFFGIPYLITSRKINKQRLEFIFQSRTGRLTEKKSGYVWGISGYCNNKSDKPNTIVRIALVVWKNKNRNSYKRFGYGVTKIIDLKTNKQVNLPLYFKSRQCRHLSIEYEITLEGTSDEKIMKDTKPLKVGGNIIGQTLKRTYELCFEDVDGNYFSQNGKLVNTKEAELWWLLPNTTRKIEDWKFEPLIQHSLKILGIKIKFFFKRLFWAIGL